MQEKIEMVMIRGLVAASEDCTDFDIKKSLFNAMFYTPKSEEVREARKRLAGALKEAGLCGSENWLVVLSAITDYGCECIREGYFRGEEDANRAFIEEYENTGCIAGMVYKG